MEAGGVGTPQAVDSTQLIENAALSKRSYLTISTFLTHIAHTLFGAASRPPPYSVPVHVGFEIPDYLRTLNSPAVITPDSLIGSPRKNEPLQEAPIRLPDYRILRKAQDRGDLFH